MRVGAIGGIGLIVAAVAGFLLKHTEPPQWEWLLARVGIATAKSMEGGNRSSGTTIRSGLSERPRYDACANFKSVSEKVRNNCEPVATDDLLKALGDKSGSGFPSGIE